MKTDTLLEKSHSFVASEIRRPLESKGFAPLQPSGPAITLSHQTGTGATGIAEQLARILQEDDPECGAAWKVFDRQLVERALEEHHWPKALANKMPEDKRSYIDDVMDELFGLRPPSWVLVPQVVETTLRLAAAGHVILIGRGASVVTARLPNVFHVRLIASLSKRIERVQQLRGLSRAATAELVRKEDRGRQRYVKTHFHARLDADLMYDVVINTDRVAAADAAAVIAEGARRCFRLAANVGHQPAY
jgi:cytidylate kinase